MKTTLNLDDDLLRSAKRRALAEGTTLTALVESGLRLRIGWAQGESSSDDPYPELSPVAPPGFAAELLDADRGEA